MSLVAFPQLQSLNKEKVAEGFLDNVSTNQNWKIKPRNAEQLVQKILKSNNESKQTKSVVI